ncbi:class A sortase [Enterococcus sp. DIV2359]|uniref:class A sortase n=1 Tax=Enterococcus sp. DIV2359 TaxID=2774995 RepID=UPI001AC1CA78|nr:class A sortase [Enterococcus sp. DIV1271a]
MSDVKKKKVIKIGRSRAKRKKRILIAAGSASVFLFVSMFFLLGYLQQRSFEKSIAEIQVEALTAMESKDEIKPRPADYSGMDVETLEPRTLNVNVQNQISRFGVGMIEIPSIDLKLPVLEGITQANISVGVGTVKPNQAIGEGNFALLGHYMTNSGLLLGGLKQVSIGDEIHLTYFDKQATYRVIESKVIHQSEGEYMLDNPEDPHYLTLLTCDGSRVETDYRLMVRAEPIE